MPYTQHGTQTSVFEILKRICSNCNELDCECCNNYTIDTPSINESGTFASELSAQTEDCILLNSSVNPIGSNSPSVSQCTLLAQATNYDNDNQMLSSRSIDYISDAPGADNTSMFRKQNELNFEHRGIYIVNLNVRHLKPKIDDVKIMLQELNNVDILGLCETFLNRNVDDGTINSDGYKTERKDRDSLTSIQNNILGGIVIYIANHINYVNRYDLEIENIESVWLKIKIKNSKSFLTCSVYRPLSAKTEWFNNFAEQLENKFNEFYVMGDLNVDINDGNISNQTWKHIVELHNKQQLIKVPTRITAHSETLIDHVYVSKPENVISPFVPYIALSGRYPICFTRTTTKQQVRRTSHKTIK